MILSQENIEKINKLLVNIKYNFMVYLVNKARKNQQPTFLISTNPSIVTLNMQGNQLVGQTKIVFGNIGYYTIDNNRLPSGVTISGYTRANSYLV